MPRARASLSLVVTDAKPLSDAALAEGLIAGESWALTETWHRFAPLVQLLAERTLGSKTDAEDITQETFVRVVRAASSLREPDKLRSFIYSVAVRTLRSNLRHRRVRAWLSFEAPEKLIDLNQYTMDVESRHALQKFYVLLDRLSARERLVFVLRRIQAMTTEEVAAAMGVSVSTVKRSMQSASTRLVTWIAKDPALEELAQGELASR